ncbi:MAG TPA: cation:dicarboxylase symporter family transporter, partial [Saprospiraceae bacterium]|nr:cation:dicarboxylase symporter family transporter [Saprospiraceae bacterium]
MKKLPLHWQILLGMLAGVIFGYIANQLGWKNLVIDWIKPFGVIFINLLKVIAIPLIVASLIKGVSDLKDISKLSVIGGRTFGWYIFTTVVAISLGLIVVNIVRPGYLMQEETRNQLLATYSDAAGKKIELAIEQQNKGPLQPLVDLVPDNIFNAATTNTNMLQVIVAVLLFGIGLVLIPEEKARPVKLFFDGLNEVILKIVDLIMLSAPYGVFALLAALVVESPGLDLFVALL